ncbi:uncharacterized protein LOC106638933 [Copidosoma floridanum]|uniref:uncharacterized protein LOC106638933 n=1 Tax=Copidosoma floridanum TaxID=29053 RepID=UPI0006C952C5|nr:uncharacterized protein LOC106638933 [Copidosoma floridanum]
MAYSDIDWVRALPLVLLGIRSAFKEDIKATLAEMVYGETLCLPHELFVSSPVNKSFDDLKSFLSSLREFMSRLRPAPASRHCQPGVFVFKELSDCSHAILTEGPILKAQQPPDTEPFAIVERDQKTVTLRIRGNSIKFSINRVKPAFVIQDEVLTPVSTSVPVFIFNTEDVPTVLQPVVERTTRSGRKVRFRDVLNL